MPSATDELRREWWPDGEGGDHKATDFLRSRGFVLTPAWEWFRREEPTEEESRAIDFMFQEWDYGGWTDKEPAS